jgi:hypothetical protein
MTNGGYKNGGDGGYAVPVPTVWNGGNDAAIYSVVPVRTHRYP